MIADHDRGPRGMADDVLYDEYEEWQLVGERYFSRRQLYALDWDGGSGGGPGGGLNLAFMRCVCHPLALHALNALAGN